MDNTRLLHFFLPFHVFYYFLILLPSRLFFSFYFSHIFTTCSYDLFTTKKKAERRGASINARTYVPQPRGCAPAGAPAAPRTAAPPPPVFSTAVAALTRRRTHQHQPPPPSSSTRTPHSLVLAPPAPATTTEKEVKD